MRAEQKLDYLLELKENSDRYNGFSLVTIDRNTAGHYSLSSFTNRSNCLRLNQTDQTSYVLTNSLRPEHPFYRGVVFRREFDTILRAFGLMKRPIGGQAVNIEVPVEKQAEKQGEVKQAERPATSQTGGNKAANLNNDQTNEQTNAAQINDCTDNLKDCSSECSAGSRISSGANRNADSNVDRVADRKLADDCEDWTDERRADRVGDCAKSCLRDCFTRCCAGQAAIRAEKEGEACVNDRAASSDKPIDFGETGNREKLIRALLQVMLSPANYYEQEKNGDYFRSQTCLANERSKQALASLCISLPEYDYGSRWVHAGRV